MVEFNVQRTRINSLAVFSAAQTTRRKLQRILAMRFKENANELKNTQSWGPAVMRGQEEVQRLKFYRP